MDPEAIALFSAVKKENCWPCSAYSIIWDAIGNGVKQLFPNISTLALNTLGVGLLFWTALTVGKFVATVKEPNIKEFTTNFFKTLFKAFIASVILLTPENTLAIIDLVVTPVITSFTDLSRAVLFAEPTIAKHFAAPSFSTDFAKDYPIFTAYLGNQIQDIIYRIYIAFNSGIALGAHMLISIDLMSWVIGIFIILVFFYMMLLFPLLFLESFFMLGAVIILFPFFLAAWVFPSTKGYMKTAWDVLFQATAQILMTCVYIGVLITVIKTYSDSSSFSLSKQLTDPALLLGIKNLSDNGIAFFALIYCMFKLSDDIPNITSFFVGEVNRSKVLEAFSKVQNLAINAGKFVAGAALVGSGIGAPIGKGLMTSAAMDTSKTLANFGSFDENGGGNDELKNMQADSMRQQQQKQG